MRPNKDSQPPIRVDEFPVSAKHLRPTIFAGILMLLSSRRSFIAPGSLIYEYLLAGHPSRINATNIAQSVLFYALFGAHIIETIIFATTKLKRHGVPTFGLLWLKWVAACFVGGVFTTKYFNGLVARKSAAKST